MIARNSLLASAIQVLNSSPASLFFNGESPSAMKTSFHLPNWTIDPYSSQNLSPKSQSPFVSRTNSRILSADAGESSYPSITLRKSASLFTTAAALRFTVGSKSRIAGKHNRIRHARSTIHVYSISARRSLDICTSCNVDTASS